MLIYWQYNAAIESDIGQHIDTLCTVGKTSSNDIMHYVVSPETATRHGTSSYPMKSTDDIEIPNVLLDVQDPYNEGKVNTLKIHITLIKENPTASPVAKGEEETNEKISKKKLYLSRNDVQFCKQEGYNAIVLLFCPADAREDLFPYVRWLDSHAAFESMTGDSIDQSLTFFQSMIPHDSREVKRSGGSNGKIDVSWDLLNFLHFPSTTPRKNKACVWIPSQNNRTWHVLYINCYKTDKQRHVTKYTYSNPVQGGQLKLNSKTLKKLHPSMYKLLSLNAKYKALTPYLCDAINRSRLSDLGNRLVSDTANKVQKLTNSFTRLHSKNKIQFYDSLLCTCKITLLMHAVKNHADIASKGSSCLRTRAFFENKILLYSRKYSDYTSKFAQGRGGNGPGMFVFGLVDHSWKRPLSNDEIAILRNEALRLGIIT